MSLVLVCLLILLSGCSRAKPPAPSMTRLERSLATRAQPKNALHRALDLWYAKQTNEAVALVLENSSSPQELVLAPAGGADAVGLTRSEKEDVLGIAEGRVDIALELVARLFADEAKARNDEDDRAESDRIREALRALADSNQAASEPFVKDLVAYVNRKLKQLSLDPAQRPPQ